MSSKKVLLLGDIGVGKTSLVRRFILDEFGGDYLATIGVDLYRTRIDKLGPHKNQALDVVIWDTDGNFGPDILDHVYGKGTSGALIIGDVTRPATLVSMAAIADRFVEMLPSRHFTFVLNKLDLIPKPDPRILPEGIKREDHLTVWTSALTSVNVDEAFRETANAILRREF
jgi:Ras-related protein Rab-22